MQSRPLAPGLPDVSIVGFGAMPLSIQGRPDPAAGKAVLHAAFDAGITLIDTADVYCLDDHDTGHNERLIAESLRSWEGPRDRILVATKGGLSRPEGRWERNASPRHLRQACERSLMALGVEQIALYQLHAPDPAIRFEDSVATLAELRREGKIRWVGLSNVTVAQIEAATRIVPISTVQNRLSPFFREALVQGVVAYCARQGIGFLAYSPVGGRRLNRKLPGHPVLRELSARLGQSPHAIVIAWMRTLGATVFPIPGARTAEHVRDSARAADVVLSPEDLRAISDATFDRT